MPDLPATSPRLMRRLNREAVVRYALDAGDFTAGHVMKATGLTRATVLGVCSDLVAQGWLEELPESAPAPSERGGRPSRLYRVPPSAGLVVGLDAGEHRFRAMVSDLRGEHRITRHLALAPPETTGPERLASATQLIGRLLNDAGARPSDVLLSVVGVPAPVDAGGASPPGDRGFWATMNPGFTAALPGRVAVENDANLAALAERARLTGTDSGNMAALLSGERLGAGLIVDGRLLRGARGGAGELRALGVVTGAGSSEGIGSLARRWAQEAIADGTFAAPVDEVDAAWVFAGAAHGDPRAEEIVARLGDRLATVALILGSLLDVTAIVVAGAVADSIEPVLQAARNRLAADHHPPVPELFASALGGDVVALGAIEHALALVRADPLGFTPGGTATDSPRPDARRR